MQQIVAANDFSFGVRQKGEGVSSLATERRGFSRGIHADRYWSYSLALELTQTVLNTPQLGVAERSPIAPVENQKQASRFLPVRAWHRLREQRGHRHQVSAGIGKGKVGGLLASCGRARRCRQLARSIHRCVAEEDSGSKTQRRKDRANDLPAEARWARERPPTPVQNSHPARANMSQVARGTSLVTGNLAKNRKKTGMAANASRNPIQIRQLKPRFAGPGALSCRFIVFGRIAYITCV